MDRARLRPWSEMVMCREPMKIWSPLTQLEQPCWICGSTEKFVGLNLLNEIHFEELGSLQRILEELVVIGHLQLPT